ncbi:MAG TPA: DUF2784 domain-containing protein [Tepidisphaeraceae bacterium]|jgi:hypothetical protein|nr:DUF2784 domain-containing protein [Tepidisphaeraceae bacterium]
MLFYRLAADFILLLHTALIAFIIGVLLLALIGYFRHWRWTRNPWLRLTHLALISYVILESWFSLPCPLTDWENALRLRAHQDPYTRAGCIADWLHRLIFFDASPWTFTICYTTFGLLVLATLILAPPRFRH